MEIGLNTFHISDRYGRDERGTLDRKNLVASIEAIAELGFKNVDVLTDVITQHPDFFNADNVERMVDLSKRYHLTYTAHLPYKYVDLSSLNENIRLASVESVIEGVKAADRIGAHFVVVHPIGAEAKGLTAASYPASEEVKRLIYTDMLAQARRSLDALIRAIQPSRLCLENLLFIDFEQYDILIRDFDLSVCFDVGHLLIRNGDPIEFIRKYKERMAIIHLHDVVRNGNSLIDHQPLGTGILDLDLFFDELLKINYQKHIVVELLNKENTVKTIGFLKKFLKRKGFSFP